MHKLRLLRLNTGKRAEPKPTLARVRSPSGGSTLITSAPRSASTTEHEGPMTVWPSSRMRIPESASSRGWSAGFDIMDVPLNKRECCSPSAEELNANQQCRDATHHKAYAIAAREVEQAGVYKRQSECADLAERKHAAGYAAAHALRRSARGFRQEYAVPGQRRGAPHARDHADQQRRPTGAAKREKRHASSHAQSKPCHHHAWGDIAAAKPAPEDAARHGDGHRHREDESCSDGRISDRCQIYDEIGRDGGLQAVESKAGERQGA